MLKSDTGRVGVQEKVWVGLHPVQIFPKWILQKRASFPIRSSLIHTDPWPAMWSNAVSKQKYIHIMVVVLSELCQISFWFYQLHVLTGNHQDLGLSHIARTPDNFSARWPPKIRLKYDNFNWKCIFLIQCRVHAWWEMTSCCENFQNFITSKYVWGFPPAICNVRIVLVCPLIIHIFHVPKNVCHQVNNLCGLAFHLGRALLLQKKTLDFFIQSSVWKTWPLVISLHLFY